MIVDGLGTSVNTAREDSSEYSKRHLYVLNRTGYRSGGTLKHVASACVSNSLIMDAHALSGKKVRSCHLMRCPFQRY